MARCAFCHRVAKLSGEHIWSDWINGLLGRRKYEFKTSAEDGTILRRWTSEELNWKAKVVCESCNNGWMSDLENDHAKPILSGIISGRPVSVLPLGIASLGAVGFKTAIIADHMSGRAPFFVESVRSAFRKSLRIPSNVQMWLAAFHEPKHRDGILRSYYVNVRHPRYGHFQYFVLTYGLMPFLIQVVSRKWIAPSAVVPKRAPVPRVIQNDFWNDIPQYWPPDGKPVAWPPEKYLGRDMLKTFTDRWTELRSDV